MSSLDSDEIKMARQGSSNSKRPHRSSPAFGDDQADEHHFDSRSNDLSQNELSLSKASSRLSVADLCKPEATNELQSHLEALRAERNKLCAEFLAQTISIPDFCISMDEMGKCFERLCVSAKDQSEGKCASSL